jgi:soluble lytic murein transglycosylase
LERLGKEPERALNLRVADARDALLHAEAAELGLAPTSADARTAKELAKSAAALLPEAERAQGLRAPELELSHIEGLEQAGYPEEALAAADALAPRLGEKFGVLGCRLAFARAKVLAGQRKWSEAADVLGAPAERCKSDAEVRARLLFLVGKYSQAADRDAAAARYFELLETEFPGHRLADDARLKRAQCYAAMGVEARFTELLSSMPEDYPNGDMTMDGVLELSMRRIEKQDWSGAAAVLERGVGLVRAKDSARGTEYSGRERYFLARARYETGARAQALDEYAAIVRDLPLSYYMLHAYSRLLALDPARAKASLAEGLRHASEKPFSFVMRPEFERPEFRRALELLRVGDLGGGRSELAALGLSDGADASVLWGVALLYARAGAAGASHVIARGQLTDWFGHWPTGAWRSAWELGFPRPYGNIVERESKRSSVPEWLIYAVMREESAFDPEAQSPARAYGLMQLIVPTAKQYAKRLGLPYEAPALRRPAINVALGSNVLRDLTERFDRNPLLAIPGYNAGPGRPARWLRERPSMDFDVWVELIPLTETRRYTKRVLASRAAYAYLYHSEAAEQALLLPLRLEAP